MKAIFILRNNVEGRLLAVSRLRRVSQITGVPESSLRRWFKEPVSESSWAEHFSGLWVIAKLSVDSTDGRSGNGSKF